VFDVFSDRAKTFLPLRRRELRDQRENTDFEPSTSLSIAKHGIDDARLSRVIPGFAMLSLGLVLN
jgi:hypothetical protein